MERNDGVPYYHLFHPEKSQFEIVNPGRPDFTGAPGFFGEGSKFDGVWNREFSPGCQPHFLSTEGTFDEQGHTRLKA